MSQNAGLQAMDLSHHLSNIARARTTSPLKGLQEYFGRPGMISLAGGLPHPDYFPFSFLGAEVLTPDAYSSTTVKSSPTSSFLSTPKKKKLSFQVPKYPTKSGDLNLALSLQYSLASGVPALQSLLEEITMKVYQPAYSNYATLVHTGNTDAWAKVVLTLCNPGDGVLACEWTYPSALYMMLPHGIKPVPVPMDGQGMKVESLRTLLSQWDDKSRGMPRPLHLGAAWAGSPATLFLLNGWRGKAKLLPKPRVGSAR
ncbi:hypothetical protein H0H81_003284 [Sphagnurus paluster]|uniref:Uncharacterized protein n=1 Tax=Sphagnurus paluster TaxID=117069 RepID=A0A9P7K5J2_9AGAR|nr:hypothetical protein H0H81_003284 [Sphagnurus paluster]